MTFSLKVVTIRYAYVLSLILTIVLLKSCEALYEDQVGLFDWRQQFVGKVEQVYFEQVAHSRRLFVSTESNVVAAISTRNGAISWRKVLEKKCNKIESFLYNVKSLVTVTSNGTVRSWEPTKGHLAWESHLEVGEAEGGTKQAILIDEETNGLVVMSHASVHMLSQVDGSSIWEYVTPSTPESPHTNIGINIGISVVGEKLALLSKDASNIQVRQLDLDSGKVEKQLTSPYPMETDGKFDANCKFVAGHVTCIDKNNMHVIDINSAVSDFHTVSLAALDSRLQQFEGGQISAIATTNQFVVSSDSKNVILLEIGEANDVKLLHLFDKPGFLATSTISNKLYYFYVSSSSDDVSIDVYEEGQFDIPLKDLAMQIPLSQEHGRPTAATVFMYQKKAELGYRLVLTHADHSLRLLQHVSSGTGKFLWTREEALAGVTDVKMIELPPSTSATKLELLHGEFRAEVNAGVLTMLANRIKSQLRQFQAFTQSLKKPLGAAPDPPTGRGVERDESVRPLIERDQFNIIKLVLLMTEGGKLFAISSRTGLIVWSRYIPDIHPLGGNAEQKKFFLAQQRSSSHFPLPPQCVLIGSDAPNGGHGLVYYFNPLTGEGIDKLSHKTDFDVAQVSELPIQDANFLDMIAILDTSLNLHVYPESARVSRQLRDALKSQFVHLIDRSANTVKGYAIEQAGGAKLHEVWSINIPNDQEFVQVSGKRSDEVVNSVGRVLGDHSVLYKYLNPNAIAFSTMTQSVGKSSLFLYVLDAVTGHILYHTRHKTASEPVHFILSEHWLLYTYYNPKARRTELSVVEFYEGFEEKNHTAFSSLDPSDTPVMVLSQSYVLHASRIRVMQATNTERGITSKNILMGLENGYVLSIPKNFLDPRRSAAHTPMLQEEGLHPYMPELPLMPQSFINYNVTLHNIRGIHTSAAGLESTSLVLVYGLDLFSTRVTPSKMFDVLKEDFDYILIALVVSALILCTIICGKLSSMRALNMAWK